MEPTDLPLAVGGVSGYAVPELAFTSAATTTHVAFLPGTVGTFVISPRRTGLSTDPDPRIEV
jgi:hypothetical protein